MKIGYMIPLLFLCPLVKTKDPDGASLESEMPTNSRLEILRHPDGNVGQKPEDEVAANSGSFKLLGFHVNI